MPSLSNSATRLLEQFKRPDGGSLWRIVWSEERHEWRFGELKRKYGNGRNRWILEKWCAPSTYGSEEEWNACKDEKGVLILGPYPRQGDWEHSYTFEVPVMDAHGKVEGAPYEPTEEIVSLYCKMIERGMMDTQSQRWAAIQETKAKQAAADKAKFDDLWDDCAPAPGAKLPDHIERLDSFDRNRVSVADIPVKLPKRGFGQIGDK